MFDFTLAPKAVKNIAKLGKSLQCAILDYLKTLKATTTLTEIRSFGGKELTGNLKGLWKFKHKTFNEYRLIGYRKKEAAFLILCVEPRRSVYQKKDGLAKKARQGAL